AGSSLLYGAISGGIGGFLTVLAVQWILVLRHSSWNFVRAMGRAVAAAGLAGVDPRVAGLACATLGGAILGAGLGAMTRRLLKVLPRFVFFALFLPILWLFV